MNVEEVFKIAEERNALAEHEVKELLKANGIPVPNFCVIEGPEEVEKVNLKFPVVVKASSPKILHKTDVGAVVLGVKDKEELRKVAKEFKQKFPDAKILVEEMEEKKLEVIIGVIHDATFGLAIMFGLGGIFVEVLKDVTFRVIPITRQDAEEMLSEIKGSKLLEGFRGIKVDREAVIELLLKISDLAQKLEGVLDQMDLNPVFVKEQGVVVVDAKIMLKKRERNMNVLKESGKAFLLGNEAIVRGALEAGVAVAATYPGTPSSEIGDTFARIYKDVGIYFEYSTNEKVALEVAACAAISGLRSIVSMKHVGLNVAADSYMTLGYVGVRGGMVIVSADDPSMHSSQNEQDNRNYGIMAHIPVIEPSNPNEMKELTKLAFEISEKFEVPVLIRITTRTAHMRGIVDLGEIKRNTFHKVDFKKDPLRFVVVPSSARKNRLRQLERDKLLTDFSDSFDYNRVEKYGEDPKVGIVASGASYNYVRDAINLLGISAEVFKVTMSNPLPKKKLAEFLKRHEHVVVFEETEPVIERGLKEIAYDNGIDVKIHGKLDGTCPYPYEYNPDIVAAAIAKVLGMDYKIDVVKPEIELPSRPPLFCPGCPHRASFYAAKKVFGEKAVAPTDIGCYTLGFTKPFKLGDLLLSMGSSFGMGSALGHFINQIVVSFIGDSTFFHAGIPALVNAIYHKTPGVFVILDNEITAMTGGQPTPEIEFGDSRPIKLVEMLKGMGIEKIIVTDPYDIPATIEAFKKAKEYAEKERAPAVVICRRMCALEYSRKARKEGKKLPKYEIDQEKCKKCMICVKTFSCPAFTVEEGEVRIRPELCIGCGACAHVCPFGAIHKVGE